MKLTSHMYVVSCFFERNVMTLIKIFLTGILLAFNSLIAPPFLLHNFSINKIVLGVGVCFVVIAVALFVFMMIVLAFVSPTSPNKREMLVNEINSLKKDIAILQSEHWLEMVKGSLGDKFDRITSEQYLLDERKKLIHRRHCSIEAMKACLK